MIADPARLSQPLDLQTASIGKNTTGTADESRPERRTPPSARNWPRADGSCSIFFRTSDDQDAHTVSTTVTAGALEEERQWLKGYPSTEESRRPHREPPTKVEGAFTFGEDRISDDSQFDNTNARDIDHRVDHVNEPGKSERGVREPRGVNDQQESQGGVSDAGNANGEVSSEGGDKQPSSPGYNRGSQDEPSEFKVNQAGPPTDISILVPSTCKHTTSSEYLRDEGSILLYGDGEHEQGGIISNSEGTRSEGPLPTGKTATDRDHVCRASKTAEKITACAGRNTTNDFDDNAEGKCISGRENDENTLIQKYPTFAAAQLGLEGEGLPDAVDFHLDDLSDIEVGWDWEEGVGAEGTVSS